MPDRILVVEDEPDLNRMIVDFLSSCGFQCDAAVDGAQAFERFFLLHHDLVVLDIMIPAVDGMAVARGIRARSDVPIVFLTARGEEEDRLAGFDAGADDYLIKPFSFRELEARIRAVLRRTQRDAEPQEPVTEPAIPTQDQAIITRGNLTIDTVRRKVTRDGQRVELTGAQFDLLVTMASDPGRVFTRLQLLGRIQEDSFAGYERTIDVHIKNLRKAIETDTRNPRYIETVWGVGYRFGEDL